MKAVCSICDNNNGSTSGISLEGHLVRLRPWHDEDIPFLFALRNDVRNLHLWTTRRELVSFAAFQDELRHDERYGMLRLIIEKRSSGERIGNVFIYDRNHYDRHCSLATVLCPDAQRRGYGAEATALFLQYLFAYLELEKVYAQVYQYNSLSRETLEHGGFKLEGTFPRHHLWDGRWWTMFQYAYYAADRDHLTEVLARFCPYNRRNTRRATGITQSLANHYQYQEEGSDNVCTIASR